MATIMAFIIIIYITLELIWASDQCQKQLNSLLKDLRMRQNTFGSDETQDWEQKLSSSANKLTHCLLLLW